MVKMCGARQSLPCQYVSACLMNSCTGISLSVVAVMLVFGYCFVCCRWSLKFVWMCQSVWQSLRVLRFECKASAKFWRWRWRRCVIATVGTKRGIHSNVKETELSSVESAGRVIISYKSSAPPACREQELNSTHLCPFLWYRPSVYMPWYLKNHIWHLS